MSVHRTASAAASVLLLALAADAALAAPYVPGALAPWAEWVLHDHRDLACTRVDDDLVCAWPGRLELSADAAGGAFTLTAWADRETWVGLPGGGSYWPQGVTLDGAVAVVGRDDGGNPRLKVGTGAHAIAGRFVWPETPEVIRVPGDVAVVALTAAGQPVVRPRFDAEGRLWIQEGGGEAREDAEDESVRVSVYRRLADGVPLRVTSMLQLNVSGRAREVSLGPVLLAGTRPVTVRGDLPVRITPAGETQVYVRPGTHQVEIDALLTTPADTLVVPARADAALFDPQEVWVWHPDPAIRQVELSGLTGVDPGRTSLPAQWHGATTFLAEPGQSLTFATARRGEPAPPPNQLHLSRDLWLDLDGHGYTVRDRLSGTMTQGWRLEHSGPGVLGRVRKVAAADDLLITSGLGTDRAGVELREAAVDLEAELRLEDARDDVPAVGWAHDVQSLQARLHLPPGWTLLHAGGVDDVGGTWIDSWSLFELFILLLISLGMGRLFGWPWALVAGLAMVLSHDEPDAPRLVWFNLLAGIALLGVLPKTGWFRRAVGAYLAVGLVSLVVILFPYARLQLRYAFHPQVEDQWAHAQGYGLMGDDMEPFAPQQEIMNTRADSVSDEIGLERKVKKGGRYGEVDGKDSVAKFQLQQIDPNAVVQTGPGVPTWTWNTWHLGWSGPVFEGHQLDLWLLSPGWNQALSVLRVLFFILMSLVFLLPGRLALRWGREGFDPLGSVRRLATGASALLLVVPMLAALAPDAAAQTPPVVQQQAEPHVNQLQNALALPTIDPDLLQTLRRRLVADRQCDGPCLVVPSMTVRVDDRALVAEAEVHVGRQASGWLLPGPAGALRLDAVEVDGEPTRQLRRSASGLVAVRLAPGRHVVTVRGTLGTSSVVTLQLDPSARPQRVTFEGAGWLIDGLDRYGVPAASLQLSRRADSGPGGGDAAPVEAASELPPWYDVQRRLSLGMPWQTRTTVQRGDSERPQLVKIPLLPGESVISEGVRVEGGQAHVQFARGVAQVSYTSELPVAEELTLAAPTEVPWAETWILECSRIWRCTYGEDTDGAEVRPIHTIDGGELRPTWQPWPGESVQLTVGRPAGTPGAATTLTEVTYEVTPGKRLLEAQLLLVARASQGAFQRLTLPDGAQLQEVTIRGAQRTLELEGRVLNVPLEPGEQRITVRWQQAWERGVFESVPVVDVGSPAANARIQLDVGADRWMLRTHGPDWGPAVLFWTHLGVLLVLALLLGRLSMFPLRTHDWFLLAIGMSQLPVIAMLALVGWFAMLLRRRSAPFETWARFDAYQVALAGATFAALGILYAAVHTNLLFEIDMQVQGAGSSNRLLGWYVDRIDGATPEAGMISVPLLVWRGAMLLWALWLVRKLFKWLPWAWEAFSTDGLWRPLPKRKTMPPPGPPAPPVADPAPTD